MNLKDNEWEKCSGWKLNLDSISIWSTGWSSGSSVCLWIRKSRVRFPAWVWHFFTTQSTFHYLLASFISSCKNQTCNHSNLNKLVLYFFEYYYCDRLIQIQYKILNGESLMHSWIVIELENNNSSQRNYKTTVNSLITGRHGTGPLAGNRIGR
jgi:hypothetical protein